MAYKLTYFQGAGRAWAIRIAFVASGLEWTDERISGKEFGEVRRS